MKVRTVVCLALLMASVSGEANAQERFGYKGLIPGETTRDAWFASGRQAELDRCPGHVRSANCVYLEGINCADPLPGGVQYCTDWRGNSQLTFLDGVLALVNASIPVGGDVTPEVIHGQLVAKYGSPTKTVSNPYRNDYGANIPSKRYEWDVPGYAMSFDEIGADVRHSQLYVVDVKLEARVKALTVKSQI